MLSNFATELIVEILLYLPYRELLRVIRLNSRLWSIAHHPKSPLRHRLHRRTSDIHLHLNEDGNIYLTVSIDETIPGSIGTRCIMRRLIYDFSNFAIADEPYVENEEDRNIVQLEKSRVQLTYKSDDLDDSKESYNFDKFSPDLSIRLAVCHLFYIAEYLTINKEFTLDVWNESWLNKFLLHFDVYDIRLAPISFEARYGSINLSRLYESKFFQQKLGSLKFSPYCFAIENYLDIRHYEIHRNKLREVKRFMKYANISIRHNDDDLLLLDNIKRLQLFDEDEITGNGIAKLIKKIYENKQGREINIEIRTKRKFTIEEVLKYVPECKITKDAEDYLYFTNMFNEVFIVKCPNQVACTWFKLNSHDL